jgi:hypothetical protein
LHNGSLEYTIFQTLPSAFEGGETTLDRKSASFQPFCIGKGPQYRPFRDLRYVPEASRPREHEGAP